MKGAPGVFTHIFDAYVLVTIKQLAVKYGLGMMDYQEAEKPNPINWIALFDFDRVDVDHIATLFGVEGLVATNGTIGNEARFCGAEGVAGGVAVQCTSEGMCPHISII